MAVQISTSRISYAGNSSMFASYVVPFVFQANSHLKAIARTSEGVETVVTLTNHTGAGNPNGGTVRTAVEVPATSTLTIYREVPITQTTTYAEGGDFPAASHELALDKLTQIAQQLQRQIGASIRLSEATQTNPINPPVSATPHVLTTVNGNAPTWQTPTSVSTALNIPALTDTSTVGPSDELIVQQSGLPRRATAQELFTQQAIWNTVVPSLTDATTVNVTDELIVQQDGVAKRASVSEVRLAMSFAGIATLSTNKTFVAADSGNIYHFNTVGGNVTATFNGATLPEGFNVTLVNISTNNVIIASDNLKSIGTTITEQYGSAFVYRSGGSIYAVGRIV